LINFQRDLEEFKKWDAQIIGVSTDSVETNRKFAAENGIHFPLISDEDKSIKKLYGRGRVTYLIDKSGIIRFVQKGVPENQDFFNELKRLN
jgi:peroxiredoxin Q/BCP